MRVPPALGSTFASLGRHRNYRLYFYGQLVSQIGTWLQNAAQAWLVLDLTHSAQAVGVLGFALYGPYAALGLFGGALADRLDRKRTMIVTQSALALAAAALALVVVLHVDRVWVVDVLAAVRGTVLVLNNPSRQALMVQLVGRRELANAIALNSSLNNATRIVGPALAGILIATVGTAACFALNALSFIPVIVAISLMRRSEFQTRARRPKPAASSFRAAIGEGLRYARRRKTIAVALAMLFLISLAAINFNVLLPIVAQKTLRGGPQVYGLITSCFGAGALVGALLTASRAKASANVLLLAAAGFGVMQFVAAAQTNALALGATLFGMGIFYTTYTATTNALVQLATPEYLQGRIGGLYNYLFLASGPVGSLLVGWLSERSTALTFEVAGTVTLAMAAYGALNRPWPMPSGSVGARRRRT